MKNRTNRKYIILSLSVLCILLIGAIVLRFMPDSPETGGMNPDTSPDTSAGTVDVNPERGGAAESIPIPTPDTSKPVVSIQNPSPTPDDADTGNGAKFTGTEQTIQDDVVKPTPPPPPEDTNGDDTSEHEKPDDPVLENPAETPPPATPTPKPASPDKGGQPKNGDKKDGMIYILGFGWIEDHGGGGEGFVAEDMYENGNKIGNMG